MAVIKVIGSDGEVEDYDSNESSFQLIVDDEAYQPAVTTRIEVESNSQTATTGTLCGEQRVEDTSTDPFKVTVEGWITNSSLPEELTVERLLFDVNEGDRLTFTSDFPAFNPMTVSNIVVEQTEDIAEIQTAIHDQFYTAFRFQLQFGEEENDQ